MMAWPNPLRARLSGFLDRRLFLVRRHEALPLRLHHRRIFVLPTAFGLAFGVTLLTMLLASMNYALSLGYGLTFLLAATGLVSLHQTFRNLVHLELLGATFSPTHCGQAAPLRLRFRNPSARPRMALELDAAGVAPVRFDLDGGTEQSVVLAFPTSRRGWLECERLRLETRFPLGLIRGWAILTPAARGLVYPRAETPATAFPANGCLIGSGQAGGKGQDDFAGLREYRGGDAPRHVAWKLAARNPDQLHTKLFDGGGDVELVFDWAHLPPELDEEARLSRLTRWVIQAAEEGLPFALKLPDGEFPRGSGQDHIDRCLRALALHGIGDGQR